jgi:heme-degrading monooxygenase HmoA
MGGRRSRTPTPTKMSWMVRCYPQSSSDIPGLVSAHLMRADEVENGEVEFTTIIWFESLDSVKNFMGEDYRRAHVPENAQAVLKRFESEAKHFHILGYFT